MNRSAVEWFQTQAEILLRLAIIEDMADHTEVAERLRNEAIEHERLAQQQKAQDSIPLPQARTNWDGTRNRDEDDETDGGELP